MEFEIECQLKVSRDYALPAKMVTGDEEEIALAASMQNPACR
jgi:hypothetical protein